MMNKNKYLRKKAGALSLLLCTGTIVVAEEKPNILFFLVDDMGWQETSVPFHDEMTELNKIYHTPNMERLAAMGTTFTQAYACPLSSPSRVSLMTGKNAARHQVTTWTLFKDISPDIHSKNEKTAPPIWNVNGISNEPGINNTLYVTETLPGILKEGGYKTIHVGKAHWGAIGTPGENPLNLGFDVNIAGHAAGGPGSYYGINNFSAKFRNGGPEWDVPGLEKYHGKEINITEALTLEASIEIEKAVQEKKPFYLYMSHYAIHAPWEADKRFTDKYQQMGLSAFQTAYASMLESMDKSLGDLMQQLTRLGITDNTIIIFMSDNGQPKQAVSTPPLRGHKITGYEGGIRVPMIVKMPGTTKPGTRCGYPVIIEDLFPTIIDMASAGAYQKKTEVIDGVSFLSLLKGGKPKNKNRAFYWHYPHVYDSLPYSVIRKGDWKLIFYYEAQHVELYNLAADISEKKNLAEVETEKCKELRNELRCYLKEVNAGIPISKKTNLPFDLP